MQDYKPNSFKYREEQKAALEEKKIEKVISGPVITKKKGGFRKFADTFAAEDMSKVRNSILIDVIVPTVKKIIVDIVDVALYGEKGHGRPTSNVSKVSYGNYYNNPRQATEPRRSMYNSVYDEEDLILASRGEAELVLTSMIDTIDRYGFATIADLYDLVGRTNNNHCANNYGWTDLHTAEVRRVREGYILKLPKALPID